MNKRILSPLEQVDKNKTQNQLNISYRRQYQGTL